MSTKFDFEVWQKIMPAGHNDLLTMSLIFSGLAFSHPLVHSAIGHPALGPTVGAGLAAWGGQRMYKRWREAMPKRVLDSKVYVASHPQLPSPEKWRNWDGMLIGYTVDTGKPVIIDWDTWMRHCFIIGQSGVGKTVLGEWLMLQQIVRGGSMIFVDGKLDSDNLQKIHAMACYAGRRDDLLVVNPGRPEMSNSYNPILYGDPDEISSRILSLIPSAETNSGVDHYRQQAGQAITTLVSGIKSIGGNGHINVKGFDGMAYNFFDLSIILNNQKALEQVQRRINRDTSAGMQFLTWLEQYKTIAKDGSSAIDMKRMRETFGGVGGRMHAFGTGKFGQITDSYSPEVRIYDAIMANKIIYVALPTMGKAEAASNFGKMFVGDYRTAVSWLQDTPKAQRPWPPTLCFFDEAGSYVTQAWSRIFEQARSAHQVLIPAVQTIANLDAVSEELRAMVLGNTMTKIMFKLGEPNTVQTMAEIIGEEKYAQVNVGYGETESSSMQSSSATQSSSGSGASKNVSAREEKGHRVKPTTLSALDKGEAIVLYRNSDIYHVRIPQFSFTEGFMKSIGPYEVNRTPGRFVKGLDFAKKLDTLITD